MTKLLGILIMTVIYRGMSFGTLRTKAFGYASVTIATEKRKLFQSSVLFKKKPETFHVIYDKYISSFMSLLKNTSDRLYVSQPETITFSISYQRCGADISFIWMIFIVNFFSNLKWLKQWFV